MAIGQSMARRCPDQSKYEKERLAYIDKAMKDSAPKDTPQKTVSGGSSGGDTRHRFASLMQGGPLAALGWDRPFIANKKRKKK